MVNNSIYLKHLESFKAFLARFILGEKIQRICKRQNTSFQKALKAASRSAAISKRIFPHTLRHSFATHILQAGYDFRTLQELLSHSDVRTTMIYSHTIQKDAKPIMSPLDLP
jgi:site-specific recombinase XerD